ncbi:GGDEF domain-containing protein [Nocardioides sp. Kera G14]|uniref:GGDEF domain-containing protein n=1 Tax=Nocardioides sp. Kera G14 TaxID=2884264 RepID=UPI001D11BF68|nr:GGDEF domain-containing protein [Nocardioides sp. Kera G14]UDY23337.1 GGDEF domain-containing protein [Nocardioides sp. Kera G14]
MEFDVRQWHFRGAVGLCIVASICYLATFTTSEVSGEVTTYYLASLAAIVLVWLLGLRWLRRPMLYVWPLLDCLGMIGASRLAPTAAVLSIAAMAVGFLYVGFTQPRGGSLVKLPVAIVAYCLVVDLPLDQLAVRLSLSIVVWLSVSELPAWLIANLAEARRSLVKLAATDALTGLPNRREWDTEIAALSTGRRPFAVLLVDLDHFKEYNDRYGHLAGDDLLSEFGHRLTAVAGPGNLVARWGGEEFAVALIGADLPAAQAVASEILVDVPDAQTCSIGIAVHQGGEGGRELLDRADKALYAAKSAGRAQHAVA